VPQNIKPLRHWVPHCILFTSLRNSYLSFVVVSSDLVFTSALTALWIQALLSELACIWNTFDRSPADLISCQHKMGYALFL